MIDKKKKNWFAGATKVYPERDVIVKEKTSKDKYGNVHIHETRYKRDNKAENMAIQHNPKLKDSLSKNKMTFNEWMSASANDPRLFNGNDYSDYEKKFSEMNNFSEKKKQINKGQEKIIFGTGPININDKVKISNNMPFERFDGAGNDLYNLGNKSKAYKTGFKAKKSNVDSNSAFLKATNAYRVTQGEKPYTKKEFKETKRISKELEKHRLTRTQDYYLNLRKDMYGY